VRPTVTGRGLMAGGCLRKYTVMTDRVEFWQKYLRSLGDAGLCTVTARKLHRDELRALLEIVYQRAAVAGADSLVWRRCRALYDTWCRKWFPHCVDCGVDVYLIDEYYIVRDDVWNAAWSGRYRSPIGDGQLCLGCLERRLGRTLMACDFSDAPVNRPERFSERLRDRLSRATDPAEGLVAFAVERMLQRLPPEKRGNL
jgi:hypothetical protein